MKSQLLRQTASEAARCGGAELMRLFGHRVAAVAKSDIANIVTCADRIAETVILDKIRSVFPDHSIIAEESGAVLNGSRHTWIVDPLDGTSNFAAGVPWFGVMIAHVEDGVVDDAEMYLPAMDLCLSAQRSAGAWCNGSRLKIDNGAALSDVLWAWGMDMPGDEMSGAHQMKVLKALLGRVRNIRTTNCLLDAAFVGMGKFGGLLNSSCRIWDVVAPMLVIAEAGGVCTYVDGSPISLKISKRLIEGNFPILAASSSLHAEVRVILETLQRR
jgi:myo-inositol-1(or 4)-monophosphatase